MKANRANHETFDRPPEPMDRRGHHRIYYPMPLKVQGSHFEFRTVVDDLGAGGICSRSLRKIKTGDKLRFLIDFSLAGTRPQAMPKLSASGIVTRVRDLHDGTFRFAAKFIRFRLL